MEIRTRSFARAALLVGAGLLAPACTAREPAGDDIVAAYTQTCVRQSGVWSCWGDPPDQRRVKVPDEARRGFPAIVRVTRPIDDNPIALGHSHSCALLKGDVACWGSNQFDEAGGSKGKYFDEVVEPVPAWHGRATAIAVGYDYTCAALPEGVECIGGYRFGAIARRIAGMPGGITHLYTNGGLICALVDRSLACFGMDVGNYDFAHHTPRLADSQFTRTRFDFPPFPGVPTSVAIGGGTVGAGHLCAIIDGAVWCGGDNYSHQAGDSVFDPIVRYPDSSAALHFSFRKVKLPGPATAIAAGGDRACAVLSSAVWCWGGNQFGSAGAPPNLRDTPPHEIAGVHDARAVAIGDTHTCALAADGVWCWGYNEFRQLGTTTTEMCDMPQGNKDTGPPDHAVCSHVPVRVELGVRLR